MDWRRRRFRPISCLGLAILAICITACEGWQYVYPLYTPVVPHQLQSPQFPSVAVHDRVLELYRKVESRWKTSLPIGDPSLSSPPVHLSQTSAIPDIPGDRGAEAERRNFAVNIQPGYTMGSGPNGDISSIPPANATEGGNFCEEGVFDGRCILQQPVRFDGDYTISGRCVYLH
jgi:hypothetical protein